MHGVINQEKNYTLHPPFSYPDSRRTTVRTYSLGSKSKSFSHTLSHSHSESGSSSLKAERFDESVFLTLRLSPVQNYLNCQSITGSSIDFIIFNKRRKCMNWQGTVLLIGEVVLRVSIQDTADWLGVISHKNK